MAMGIANCTMQFLLQIVPSQYLLLLEDNNKHAYMLHIILLISLDL
jgi:hypothetical protein